MKVIIHIVVPPDDFEATRQNAQEFLEAVKKASQDTYRVADVDTHVSIQTGDSVSSIVETPVTPEV